MTGFPVAWRPITLPHVEMIAHRLHFLGRDVEPRTGEGDATGYGDLLKRCDGSRPLDGFATAEQELLGGWHRAGLVVLAPPTDLNRPRRDGPVVVSPHPDDAVLALGGMLACRGGRVVNVFSVETWTSDPYYAARPELTSRLLLAEEKVACHVLGVEVEMLGFTDAADRPLRRDRFFAEDPHSDRSAHVEADLLAAVTARLGRTLAGAEEIYAPLAVGGHVDHLICREAVLAVAAAGDLAGARVFLYDDQPYSVFASADKVADGLAGRLGALGLGRARTKLVALDETAMRAKQEALRAYRIQVRQGVRRRVARHCADLAAGSGHPGAEQVRQLRST